VNILFGTNPVEHFSSVKVYDPNDGNAVSIDVKLPGSAHYYMLSEPLGFMPGWLASVDANSDVTVESPDGLTYVYPDSSNHMLKRIQDADGNDVVVFDYNATDPNFVDRQEDGLDSSLYIEYVYDANWLLESVRACEDSNCRVYTLDYDESNQVVAVSSGCAACGAGGSVRYEYDANGALIKIRDANDVNVVIYEYKYASDWITHVYLGEASGGNHIQRFSYASTVGASYIADINDYTDANNYRVTREFRDSGGTVTKQIKYEELNDDPNDPNGEYFVEHTVYIRDANNNVTRKVVIPPSANAADPPDPNSGVRKEYTHDPNTDDVLTETWFDVNDVNITVSQYTYDYIFDPCGNILNVRIKTHTDARGVTTYYYYNGDDVEPSLKVMPQVTEGISGTQQLKYEYEYDNRKRVTLETQLDDSNNILAQTRYEYDNWGNLTRRLDYDDVSDSNEVTLYRYNGFNEMTRMTLPYGAVSGKSYNDDGKVESEFVLAEPSDVNESEPNLLSQTKYYYDDNGRVKEIAKAVDDGVFDYNDPNSWIWTEYEYDLRSNRTKVTEDANGLGLTTTYEYNNQGEVVQVTLPNGKWTKTYSDGRGLTTKTEVGYGGTTVATTEFKYDANGNLKWQKAPDGFWTRYDYDDYDRLIGVIKGL
jgi:YD repeat-containing protein